MLQFDAKTAKLLDDGYQGSDIAQRRLANLAALAPGRDNVIADIGAGTGLLTLDLARAAGETGQVIAIDPSPEMRAPETHLRRCVAEQVKMIAVPGNGPTPQHGRASQDGCGPPQPASVSEPIARKGGGPFAAATAQDPV